MLFCITTQNKTLPEIGTAVAGAPNVHKIENDNADKIELMGCSTWLQLQPSDRSVNQKAYVSTSWAVFLLHYDLSAHASSLVGLTVV